MSRLEWLVLAFLLIHSAEFWFSFFSRNKDYDKCKELEYERLKKENEYWEITNQQCKRKIDFQVLEMEHIKEQWEQEKLKWKKKSK